MWQLNFRVWLALIFLVSGLGPFVVLKARGQVNSSVVRSISIEGNQRIDDSAILGRITVNVGEQMTTEISREQIRKIYNMGFFEDVQVKTKPVLGGIDVIFVVTEKPFTVEIVFDGNKELSEDKLQEVVTLKSQVFSDPKEIKVSAEKIREAYRKDGYHNAQVIPVVQTLDESRNRITFFIQEGKRARIRDIAFEGVTVVEKSDLLAVMANREWVPIISLLTDAGILHQEELPNDVERIREFYSNKGYLDVQVGLPSIVLSDDKESFTLTFHIVEGFPYTIGSVGYEGNTVFEDEELELQSFLRSTDVFQRALVRQEVTRITDRYGEKGYSFTLTTKSTLSAATWFGRISTVSKTFKLLRR